MIDTIRQAVLHDAHVGRGVCRASSMKLVLFTIGDNARLTVDEIATYSCLGYAQALHAIRGLVARNLLSREAEKRGDRTQTYYRVHVSNLRKLVPATPEIPHDA